MDAVAIAVANVATKATIGRTAAAGTAAASVIPTTNGQAAFVRVADAQGINGAAASAKRADRIVHTSPLRHRNRSGRPPRQPTDRNDTSAAAAE